DLMQCLFTMVSLNCLLLTWKGARGWWLVSMVSFILGLLSREVAILLPAYIFLLGIVYHRQWKKALVAALPYFAVAAIYYILRQNIFPISSLSPTRFLDVHFLLEWGTVVCSYLLRFLLPWTIFAHLPAIVHQAVIKWLAAAALVAVCAVALKRKKFAAMNDAALVGFIWLIVSLVALVTTLHMFAHLGPYLSEHFLYFPSIGFALLVAAILKSLPSPRVSGAIMLGLCAYFLTVGIINRD